MPRTKKVTTSIYCNRYKPNKEGLCVVSIRLHWNDSRRTYDTGYQMTPSAFDALFLPKIRPDQKAVLMDLNAEEQRAGDIIRLLKTGFTWERFERSFLSNISIADSLKGAFDGYTQLMNQEEQYSTIVSYQTARNAFERYRPGTMIGDVSVSFLHGFEKNIVDAGGSITTVGIYCRSLRAVLNWVISDGRLSKELYPFGKSKEKKYEIPVGRNIKKALSTEDIFSIFHYQAAPGSMEEMSRDYWVFMYMANGMNVKDFCNLKWSNLNDLGITFVREKTKRTKKVKEPVQVIMQPEMKNILKKWGNCDKGKDAYIFPHLSDNMTLQDSIKKVKLLTRLINKYMDRIAINLGIDSLIHTNDARHSFATVLKNSGAPLAMISEAMAHSSIATTQNYLASFETTQLKKHTTALTSFLHKKAANE